MYNPNMYRNNSYYENVNSPFNVARMNNTNVFFTPKKTMNMRNLINNAEKGIDTISSIIPLAQKMTPLITTGKDFVTTVKQKFTKPKSKNTKKEKVEAELVDDINSKNEDNLSFSKKEETKPNNPFF